MLPTFVQGRSPPISQMNSLSSAAATALDVAHAALPKSGGIIYGNLATRANLTGQNFVSNVNIDATADGSGLNGPATAHDGMQIILKKNGFPSDSATVGELDPLQIFLRQSSTKGSRSDGSGILVNAQNSDATGFVSATEMTTSHLNSETHSIDKQMAIQDALIDGITGAADGLAIIAQRGTLQSAIIIESAGRNASWDNAIKFVGQDGKNKFLVDRRGNVTQSGTLTAAGIDIIGPFYAEYGENVTGNSVLTGYVKPAVLTVATLPACGAAISGAISSVSDATAPTFLGALTGGGSVHTPVYCNGTAWVAG